MKIDRLETHDRFNQYMKQSNDIGACCQDIIDQKPFGNIPFYIFTHKRTLPIDERYKLFLSGQFQSLEEVPSHTVIWQPRLTKPKAQTNSMLFKAHPPSDKVKIIWIIPEREQWDQYKKNNITESDTVAQSIHDFQFNRDLLEKKEDDDLNEEQIFEIYREISIEAKRKKAIEYSKHSLTCPPCS